MKSLPHNILVTGPSGSGKTTLVNYLSGTGVPAADADTIPGLAVWRDGVGNIVALPSDADRAWFRSHTFTWEPVVLHKYVKKHGPMVIAGLSDDDTRTLKDVFPLQFYLNITPEELDRRLTQRNSGFGITPEQRSAAKQHVISALQRAQDRGLVILDGSLSAERVWQEILAHINANAA